MVKPNLATLVNKYKHRNKSNNYSVLTHDDCILYTKDQPSNNLARIIEVATLSKNSNGIMHPHQCHVGIEKLQEFADVLVKSENRSKF